MGDRAFDKEENEGREPNTDVEKGFSKGAPNGLENLLNAFSCVFCIIIGSTEKEKKKIFYISLICISIQ